MPTFAALYYVMFVVGVSVESVHCRAEGLYGGVTYHIRKESLTQVTNAR